MEIVYRIDADAIVVVLWTEKKTVKAPEGIVELCRNRLKLYDAEI